jgi:multidrug efflux pump subunit AcrA (membrane-fusion protein)
MMNRETSFHSSDTLIVTDRSARRRWVIIGAVVVLALLALGIALMMGRGGDKAESAAAAKGAGQVPTVTVIVPGSSQVTRVITASGALGAKRDQPVGIAGQGGRVIRVTVDAGSWVRAGQVLAIVDRSVQSQLAAPLSAQV